MAVLATNGSIAFQPRARLLKLIGEELISDEVVAISELVKNSHDADATVVTVNFTNATSTEGLIEIIDDGCGMNLDALLGRWMEPAASTKVGSGQQITKRGRRVLGEKGVGRFATDKLARHLEIISRPSKTKEEIRAVIDWDRYNTDEKMLSEVKNRWEVRQASELRGHGTVLRMSGLRSLWSEKMFRRLCIRLSRLLSPFRDTDHFRINMVSDEFPEYSGELRSDFLEKAPYSIVAEFDGVQTIGLTINGRKQSFQRWNGQGDLSCGPVTIRLFAFDLEGEAIAKIGPRMEVRAWLKEWTGISIYRDGFRVWPYGEPHDDWLRLDQRRVNNPVERLSNNQILGFIDISRDRNSELLDQTNREGLIHNLPFGDLRRLVFFVLQAIESERQSIRHPARPVSATIKTIHTESGSIATELERLAARASGELAKELRQLKETVDGRAKREAVRYSQLVEGYSSLAAIGQMTTGLLPIANQEMDAIRSGLSALHRALAKIEPTDAHELIAELNESLTSIADFHKLVLTASVNDKRRRAIDVHAEVRSFKKLIAPILDDNGVQMDVCCSEPGVIRTDMRPECLTCILQILVTNSLDWLNGIESPRVRVSVSGLEDSIEIVFSDNGPGIPIELSTMVFDPLFTRKESGRGMGLTIARHLVESHRGTIALLIDGRRRGANLLIRLPRKRSRATIY